MRLSLVLLAWAAAAQTVTPEIQAALDRISADSLRGHVSFLASDLLEGRDTPSRGLEVAAEYVAAQFRRAGLEPAGDAGYFQTARMMIVKPNLEGFELAVEIGGQTIRAPAESVSVQSSGGAELTRAPVIKCKLDDPAGLAAMTAGQVRGKVVVAELPGFTSAQFMEGLRRSRELLARLNPALVLTLRRGRPANRGPALRDPVDPEQAGPPALFVYSPELLKAFETAPAGPVEAAVTVKLAPAIEEPVTLRNVVARVHGADPVLGGTYVLVTAHYDHSGVLPDGDSDRILNGANDDASGTASVIELAAALAKTRPRRSIVFAAWFGEEHGLLGSRYYVRHPPLPLDKTVADINLEQLGRTDSSDGPQIARASLTGFDYSDIGETFRKAGELAGVTVFKDEKNSDSFFARSDNQAFANAGIPAHTLCVAYVYPDYHRPGDEWEKIDYDNMAKIDRMTALGVLMIANNPAPPKWNEANPRAERYVKAARKKSAANGRE